MGGVSAYAANDFNEWLTPKSSPGLLNMITAEGVLYTGYSGYSNSRPENRSFMDPLVNIRSSESSSTNIQTEIKTNLNFNNLSTQ